MNQSRIVSSYVVDEPRQLSLVTHRAEAPRKAKAEAKPTPPPKPKPMTKAEAVCLLMKDAEFERYMADLYQREGKAELALQHLRKVEALEIGAKALTR